MSAKKKARSRDITLHLSRKGFAKKLRSLADAVETGRPFRVTLGGERIVIPADAVFSIEHERGKAEEEIEFQLAWKR
ncbi:MAG: hypothetical protein OHK006_21740 [Thermodesulfovibrionales bacterium]